MNKEFLKLSIENIEFDLSLLDKDKEFYWRVKIDEGDDNPIYYGDYLTNEKIYEFNKKLKEYFDV